MRFPCLLLAAVTLTGCQFDPHAHLYTTSEPKNTELIGTYVLDSKNLPQKLHGTCPEITVELRLDGTFTAKNVPPWELGTPQADFFKTLRSGVGKWEKASLGTLDNKNQWGIYLRTPDMSHQLLPANFTGEKPPYGLMFGLGDPDSSYAVHLRRK